MIRALSVRDATCARPVWVALPHAPDWRWMLNRDGSPWYRSARLFRQPRRAPWDALTATTVLDARGRPAARPGAEFRPIEPVDLSGATITELPTSNGHTLN